MEINNEKAYNWMSRNIPSCKKIDINTAKEKYEFPDYVIDWIKRTWIKEKDSNGGIYSRKI